MEEKDTKNNASNTDKETQGNLINPEDDIQEIINNLPENERESIKKSLTMSFSQVSGPFNPMVEKMTPEHITLTLQNAEKESEREFKLISKQKMYDFLLVIGALLFVFTLCYLFSNNVNSIKDILIPIATFVGGYGFGKNRK